MVQGEINRDRHTDHPAGRHSIWTNQCPPPPSPQYFFTGPSCCPTNSLKALKADYCLKINVINILQSRRKYDTTKLPNLVCIFLVALVGNQQCCKAHETSIKDIDSDVEVQNEITRGLGPHPNNRWSPVKQLGKENAASMEVTLQCTTQNSNNNQ